MPRWVGPAPCAALCWQGHALFAGGHGLSGHGWMPCHACRRSGRMGTPLLPACHTGAVPAVPSDRGQGSRHPRTVVCFSQPPAPCPLLLRSCPSSSCAPLGEGRGSGWKHQRLAPQHEQQPHGPCSPACCGPRRRAGCPTAAPSSAPMPCRTLMPRHPSPAPPLRCDTPIGLIYSINPAMIVLLVPIVGAMTTGERRWNGAAQAGPRGRRRPARGVRGRGAGGRQAPLCSASPPNQLAVL